MKHKLHELKPNLMHSTRKHNYLLASFAQFFLFLCTDAKRGEFREVAQRSAGGGHWRAIPRPRPRSRHQFCAKGNYFKQYKIV